MTVERIRSELFALSDEKYACFHAGLIPTEEREKIIGVRVPNLRKLAKRLVKEGDYDEFLHALPHWYLDENTLHALIISELTDYTQVISYTEKFLPYIDKGWTIMVFSDHSLICPEETPHDIGENSGLNVPIMKELGYTVLKKDENGNELMEIDWEKTRAIQVRANSIYVNLKGRDRYGIVDPKDKYELEEQIISDLYS